METHDLKVYGFYDGDFTFHHVEYDHEPRNNGTFRARIDNESAEERMLQNVGNPNSAPEGWSRVRPANDGEIASWLRCFESRYPLRPQGHTDALRHLRLRGATERRALPRQLWAACMVLSAPILRVRDFQPEAVCFVDVVENRFQLTEEGRWLTSLMK